MKKNISYLILLIILLISCEKVLDKKSLDKLYGPDVWNDVVLTNLYLNNVYSNILPGFGGASNSSMSDDCPGGGVGNLMYGELTKSTDVGDFSGSFGTPYTHIRKLNILIDEIDMGSIEEAERSKIKGQALFLRAWSYWRMVRFYGGVPIIMHAIDPTLEYDSLLSERNSAHECIAFIINDLDQAITLLPPTWPSSDRGRITRGAAAALKGRVLLYYASPQFNPNNLIERWQTAYNANKEAKDMCTTDGYELYNDFTKIFIDEEKCKEGIFITVHDIANKPSSYENEVRPSSESVSGGSFTNPTWDLVEAFPMKNGLPIDDPASGYDFANFWKNRDPRFSATIAYNGCVWPLSNKAGRRQWSYLGNNTETRVTITGLYCRKNVNAQILSTETMNTPTDWIEIRLAEVLLNLAECAAELGNIDEAKEELITLRKRAGIEEGDGSYGITATDKTGMIEAVMLERRIELAFENKRYWDLRRRNMFINDLGNTPKLNGTKRHTLQVTLDTNYVRSLYPASTRRDTFVAHFNKRIRDTVNWERDYDKYFNAKILNAETKDINFLQPKYNFYFIPQTDIDKNGKLKQTIYWGEGETFDPLQ